MDRRGGWWIGILATAFAVAYALVGLLRHWNFGSSAYDLAIFDQVIWHWSRFEAPASTINGHANILGDHFHPILMAFVPLYWVAPAVESLIVAQAVLLAASLLPVYAFARDRLPVGAALAMAAAHGLFWGMQRTAEFDVHELAFAPLFIAVAILAADRRQWRVFSVAAVALMLVKEDMIPVVTGLGAYAFWLGHRRLGLTLVVVSLAVFVLVLGVVIPAFNPGGGWAYGGIYGEVGRAPWTLVTGLVTPIEKLRTVLYWLAPFLFLPLRSPIVLLALPVVLSRLLSPSSNHWGHGFHYSAPLAPILAMAAADGLARVLRRLPGGPVHRRRLRVWCAGCVVVALVLPGRQPILRLFSGRLFQPIPTASTGREALRAIPAGASVVAQAAIAPHLSQRQAIFMLDEQAPAAEFVIAAEPLNPWPLVSAEAVRRLVEARRADGYRPVFERDGWIVLRR